jgi:hypothetical protein
LKELAVVDYSISFNGVVILDPSVPKPKIVRLIAPESATAGDLNNGLVPGLPNRGGTDVVAEIGKAVGVAARWDKQISHFATGYRQSGHEGRAVAYGKFNIAVVDGY